MRNIHLNRLGVAHYVSIYSQILVAMTPFAFAIFIGAFLLFQLQPLLAKYIVPWFGGGPSVWTTCMLFFQVFLLGGYAYAHFLTARLTLRKQVIVHGIVLACALLFLPIVPSAIWKPNPGDEPTRRILFLLTVCVGLPYLALAATAPLLQSWFSTLSPGKSPYRLYALSNTGSILALVTYPVLFEPALTRRAQAIQWSFGFVVFVIFCAACAKNIWEAKESSRLTIQARQDNDVETTSPSIISRFFWFSLPACSCILMLATTNKLCLDVASLPFLWVLPLTLYLLSFVICFDRPQWYSRRVMTILSLVSLGFLCFALINENSLTMRWQLLIYCGGLFLCCLVCQGEVYRLKPAARHLTSFYLWIAVGGAAGGVFVAVIAPMIFGSFAELNWGAWLFVVLLVILHAIQNTRLQFRARTWPAWQFLLSADLALSAALLYQTWDADRDIITVSRNFYGVLRVADIHKNEPTHAFSLRNGNIGHGMQFANPPMSGFPISYYGTESGVGVALNTFSRQTHRRLGVIGLGVGTIAAYAHAGDTLRFYEINPEVEKIARTRFTYLKQCPADVSIVLGDARLSLENEPPQQFDVLVLDAFSSDAIPVHLLTKEAFEIYFKHLKPDGVIALHISNRYLNLFPVMMGIAKELKTFMVYILWQPQSLRPFFSDSQWVIITRNQQFVENKELMAHATMMPDQSTAEVVLWTDDKTSLLPIFQF